MQTHLTADQAAATADAGAVAVAAYSTDASDAPTFDPRLHGIGSDIVWAVRTIAAQDDSADDPTRPGDVWLVDDATGGLIQSLPLKPEDGFSPVLLHLQATQAQECCPNNGPLPIYEVDAADGEGIAENFTDGWESGTPKDGTQWHAGAPVVLAAGDYVVRFGLEAASDDGPLGPRLDECETTISVVDGQDVRLEAAFPKTGACTFVAPTFEDVIGG